MSRLTTLVLLILSVVVSIAVYQDIKSEPFEFWRDIEQPFHVTLDGIQRVEVKHGDDPTIICERRGDGWDMLEPLEFPASVAAVEDGVAETLRSLRTRGEGSDTPGAHGIAESKLSAAFVSSEGREEIILGDEHPTLPYVYAQIRGTTYLVGLKIRDVLVAATVEILRDDAVCDITAARATGVRVEGTENSFELGRRDGVWSVEGDLATDASPAEVKRLLESLNSWAIEEFVADGIDLARDGARYGLAEPRWRVEVAEGTRRVTILVGWPGPESPDGRERVHVAWEGQPHVFLASAEPLHQLVRHADSFRDRALFRLPEPDFERITLTRDPGGPQAVRVAIERGAPSEDGGAPGGWQMTVDDDPRPVPVDGFFVTGVVEALRGAGALELFPADDPQAYGLDQPSLVIEIVPRQGEIEKLYVGRRGPNEEERVVFNPRWRFYATTVLPLESELFDLPWSFRSERPHEIGVNSLRSLTIEKPGRAPVTYVCPQRVWRRSGRDEEFVDNETLQILAAGMASLRAVQWEGTGDDGPGPDRFSLRVTIRDPMEEREAEFWIGPPLPDRERRIREKATGWVFRTLREKDVPDIFRQMEALVDSAAP